MKHKSLQQMLSESLCSPINEGKSDLQKLVKDISLSFRQIGLLFQKSINDWVASNFFLPFNESFKDVNDFLSKVDNYSKMVSLNAVLSFIKGMQPFAKINLTEADVQHIQEITTKRINTALTKISVGIKLAKQIPSIVDGINMEYSQAINLKANEIRFIDGGDFMLFTIELETSQFRALEKDFKTIKNGELRVDVANHSVQISQTL